MLCPLELRYKCVSSKIKICNANIWRRELFCRFYSLQCCIFEIFYILIWRFCWFYSPQCCIESLRLCSITSGSSMGWRMLPLWKLSPTIKSDTPVSTVKDKTRHNLKKPPEFGNTTAHFCRENCMRIKCQSSKMSMSIMMIFINSLVSYLSITKGWKEG